VVVPKTKFGVRYMYPGSFFSEESSLFEVQEIPPVSEWPKGAYAAHLYTWKEVEDEGVTLTGPLTQVGPQHIIGIKKTLEEVQADPNLGWCACNMETNEWPYVIQCRQGHIAPSNTLDDVVVNL